MSRESVVSVAMNASRAQAVQKKQNPGKRSGRHGECLCPRKGQRRFAFGLQFLLTTLQIEACRTTQRMSPAASTPVFYLASPPLRTRGNGLKHKTTKRFTERPTTEQKVNTLWRSHARVCASLTSIGAEKQVSNFWSYCVSCSGMME